MSECRRAWFRRSSFSAVVIGLLDAWTLIGGLPPSAIAAEIDTGEAHWIWTSQVDADNTSPGVCYFRKSLMLADPESGKVEISCDDRFELFVNGRRVGSGENWQVLQSYDISRLLVTGRNTIAIYAENTEGATAGLVARVLVRQAGHTAVVHSTDSSWKTSAGESRNWQMPNFNDSRWTPARSLGEFGVAEPWTDRVRSADGSNPTRFKLASEFRVERVTHPGRTGSLVALCFNELGEIIASREQGPLLLIFDGNEDGRPESVSTFCEQITNCQGILPLNGQVFAVGKGPDGTGLYRLGDADGDRIAEEVALLLKFKGEMTEHGPHAPILGPDGLIYLVLGNHTAAEKAPEPTSPYRNPYEGDLLQPRFEDAAGAAEQTPAPGGTVIRTDTEGSFVEVVAGGLRNAYDIAFNREGELFTVDSDMEWDEGLPWYRANRVQHLVPSGEYGWRSGWAKWPDYFVDSLPGTLDLGRGSPTGMEFYNHEAFPARYHNALFVGDWSTGRILAVRTKPDGGSFTGEVEVFLQGRPLNVTDLTVGPDGGLYFATGGRGTEGGVYRIVWTGRVPRRPQVAGVMQAVRQPQLASAFSRNRVATIKEQLGRRWPAELGAIADDVEAAPADRLAAMDLMHLIGPFPAKKFLIKLSKDRQPAVRAKAAYLMGIHADAATGSRLVDLMADGDPAVRRIACESLVRSGQKPPPEMALALLGDPSRFVAWSARRALQELPVETWRPAVLESEDQRAFFQGSTALLLGEPDRATIDAILNRSRELLGGFVADEEFLSMLRVMQLAAIKGKLTGADLPELRAQLAEEYPSGDAFMNRELVRLLIHLQDESAVGRMFEALHSDATSQEKLFLAMHLKFLKSGLTEEQKFDLLSMYESFRKLPAGYSLVRFLDDATRDFVLTLSLDERGRVLSQGAAMPNAALFALITLPEQLEPETIADLKALDLALMKAGDTGNDRLATGIVAVLGRTKDPDAMVYLRELFETHPERRQDLAMGLAQDPAGENYSFLLRALPVVQKEAALEIINQLATVAQKPDDAESVRQVILAGLKLEEEGAAQAIALLEKWTGEKPSQPEAPWDVALSSWQAWFAANYPGAPEAVLPVEGESAKWTFEQLVTFLDAEEAMPGDAERGALVYEKAQCSKCHRIGNRGEGLGPDLTTAGQRFQRKEIVESVIFPSHVISDRYVTQTIETTDGRSISGLVAPAGGDAIVVLQSNGEKVTLPNSEVAETSPNKQSTMPEGLFDNLTLEEISDLLAFLARPPIQVASQPDEAQAE